MKLATVALIALIALIALVGFAGCASNPDKPTLKTELAAIKALTHADLQAAAAYADQNGYAARAAVWRAIDVQLAACEAAIASIKPKAPPTGAGVFTAIEIAAEAVGSGLPAAIRVNCEALPIPHGLLIRP